MIISRSTKNGFTIIELLVAITIAAVLAAIVISDINPARRFAESRNSKRQSDVASVSNAIAQYRVEHTGAIPPGITTAPQAPVSISAISAVLVPTYLSVIPTDPQGGQYTASYDANYRVVVSAPAAELTVNISVTQ